MRVRNLALISAAAIMVSGCAAPIIGTLTLGQLTTIAGLASTATTGKGLFDHALSALTGKDCSITEGILRKDRKVCEEKNSLATKDDFKGVFAWLDKHNGVHQDAPSGDTVLAGYEKARGEELAQGNEASVTDVTPASASSLALRLAQNDDPPAIAPVAAPMAAGAPVNVDPPKATWLTFRDDEADGTPRIVSRYVYMQPLGASDPAPAAPVAAVAMAAPATPAASVPVAPVAAATPVSAYASIAAPAALAPPASVAPPAPIAPVAAVSPAPAPVATPAPVVVATRAMPVAAPQAPAQLRPVKAVPAVQTVPATPAPAAAPKVYWYLSGR